MSISFLIARTCGSRKISASKASDNLLTNKFTLIPNYKVLGTPSSKIN